MAVVPLFEVCFSAPKTKQELEKESAIYQNYDHLISTLPQSSYFNLKLSFFNGFWFRNDTTFGLKILHSTMAARDHFPSRPGDILLATIPKVGTTWLKALAFATLNRAAGPGPYPQSTLLSLNPHQCVPHLEFQLYCNDRIPDLDALPSPRLLATHVPYSLLPTSVLNDTSNDLKIIYLCRNPKDTFISLWHFANNLFKERYEPTSLAESLDGFLSGVSMFGPFWDHALEYRRASLARPSQVLFLRYEELKREPEEQLRRMAEFMGCPFSVGEVESGEVEEILKLCSFESLRGLEVNQTKATELPSMRVDNRIFFRKGEVGDWVNHLSPEMVQRFDAVIKDKFEGTGLSFDE